MIADPEAWWVWHRHGNNDHCGILTYQILDQGIPMITVEFLLPAFYLPLVSYSADVLARDPDVYDDYHKPAGGVNRLRSLG